MNNFTNAVRKTMTQAERAAKARDKRKASGLKEFRRWLPQRHHQAVTDFVDKLLGTVTRNG